MKKVKKKKDDGLEARLSALALAKFPDDIIRNRLANLLVTRKISESDLAKIARNIAERGHIREFKSDVRVSVERQQAIRAARRVRRSPRYEDINYTVNLDCRPATMVAADRLLRAKIRRMYGSCDLFWHSAGKALKLIVIDSYYRPPRAILNDGGMTVQFNVGVACKDSDTDSERKTIAVKIKPAAAQVALCPTPKTNLRPYEAFKKVLHAVTWVNVPKPPTLVEANPRLCEEILTLFALCRERENDPITSYRFGQEMMAMLESFPSVVAIEDVLQASEAGQLSDVIEHLYLSQRMHHVFTEWCKEAYVSPWDWRFYR